MEQTVKIFTDLFSLMKGDRLPVTLPFRDSALGSLYRLLCNNTRLSDPAKYMPPTSTVFNSALSLIVLLQPLLTPLLK